jgi:hypothetical protein
MVGTAFIGTAVAAAAAAFAFAGHAVGVSPATGPVSPFGGSRPTHLTHVGRIEVDVERSSSAGLRQVRCPGGLTADRCYVAP